MQNNLRNRSVALASTFALVLTGIVATAPAASAATPVELGPSSGTNLGAFTTDMFSMDIDVSAPYDASEVAIRIDNPDQDVIRFALDSDSISDVTLRGITALGAQADLSSADLGSSNGFASTSSGDRDPAHTDAKAISIDGITGGNMVYVDFETLGITSLIISNLDANGSSSVSDRSLQLDLKLAESASNSDDYDYGDGNGGDITVTAWVEVEATQDLTSVDDLTASAAATVKWYDPKGVAVIPSIERFVGDTDGTERFVYNSITDNSDRKGLGGAIQFVRPDLNLEQVDGTKWNVNTFSGTDTSESSTSLNSVRATLSGTRSNDDTAGAIYFADTAPALTTAKTYFVEVSNVGDADRKFRSVAFSPTAGPSAERTVLVTVGDTSNTDADAAAPGKKIADGTTKASGLVDRDIAVRPDTESLTYTARLYDKASTSRVKTASQPILAKVVANSFMPSGTEYTVSGSSDTITGAGQAIIVTGLTDSSGDYSVTVTSSNPVASTGYDIEFYHLSTDGEWSNGLVGASGVSSGDVDRAVTALYTKASVGAGSMTLDDSTLAGASVTAGVTVKDNYGVVTDKSGSKDLYVTFQGSDTTDLDETVAVGTDGTAAITFDNYLSTSDTSDLITVSLHTGSTFSTSNIIGSSLVISLYNPGAIGGINVPASKTGVITYDDFIASGTSGAPEDGKMQITGTVVDENGSGIPGAVVSIDAEGMQLRKSGSGDYALDSITIAANAAGQFTLDLWSHTVDTTGVDVTFTSGDQTATTTVKTYLPSSGVDGNNLVFSMDTPANIDVNKTYAMTATLTDKWGNPVQTITDAGTSGVTIVGSGSVEINSKADGVSKNFGKDGSVTVFVRSIKDIEGPGSITATLNAAAYTYYDTSNADTATAAVGRTEITTDVTTTAHDETSFSNELTVDVNVGEAAATSADQKVNAGSFKGYVAVYAKGYEGQRLSAKIGNDWVIVDPIVNNEGANLHRTTDFTGAGVDIAVRIYIDRVLVDTINLTTK